MPADSEYAERPEGAYTAFTASRGRLLGEKGGQFQHQFLSAAKSPDSFVEFMDEEVGTPKPGKQVATFNQPLTEQSFKEMTADQEEAAFAAWRSVPPRVTCRVAFWAEVTIQHIKAGVIQEAFWLAANGGRTESGEERIDRALQTEGADRAKLMDECARTILRRVSGLPTVRGNRSVFVNPSFGRAWWRERLVNRIAARDGSESKRALSNVVRYNQEYWERLVSMIVSRGSVLGSVDVQDAFVNALAKHLQAQRKSPLRQANSLPPVLRRFSNIAASRELGALEFAEIGELAERLFSQVAETESRSRSTP